MARPPAWMRKPEWPSQATSSMSTGDSVRAGPKQQQRRAAGRHRELCPFVGPIGHQEGQCCELARPAASPGGARAGTVPSASSTVEAALTSSDTVLWEQTGPVGRITLNRPETLNAWIAEFGAALRDIVEGPAADQSVR